MRAGPVLGEEAPGTHTHPPATVRSGGLFSPQRVEPLLLKSYILKQLIQCALPAWVSLCAFHPGSHPPPRGTASAESPQPLGKASLPASRGQHGTSCKQDPRLFEMMQRQRVEVRKELTQLRFLKYSFIPNGLQFLCCFYLTYVIKGTSFSLDSC